MVEEIVNIHIIPWMGVHEVEGRARIRNMRGGLAGEAPVLVSNLPSRRLQTTTTTLFEATADQEHVPVQEVEMTKTEAADHAPDRVVGGRKKTEAADHAPDRVVGGRKKTEAADHAPDHVVGGRKTISPRTLHGDELLHWGERSRRDTILHLMGRDDAIIIRGCSWLKRS